MGHYLRAWRVRVEHVTTPGRPPARRRAGLALGLPVLIAGLVVATLAVAFLPGQQRLGLVGFNWPNAGRVYVAQLVQQSTTPTRPDRPFTVARAHSITRERVFIGDDLTVRSWQQDPAGAMDRVQRMLNDAAAADVKVVVGNYLTQDTVSVLAGHGYPSWAAAQQDLTTPGSPPWNQFGAWLQALAGRFGRSPAIASFEVMNEPNWMLGLDSGAVGRDNGLRFLDHFAAALHVFGAPKVNGGGRPVYDPMTLSDTQLALYTRNLDVLDDHLYPALDPDGRPVGGAGDARAAVAGTARWFDRARAVTHRRMPGMLGEVGTVPDGWGKTAAAAGSERGWTTLAWAFDAYDVNNFTDTVHTETLSWVTARNNAALKTQH